MEIISKAVLSFCDLMEAEGRTLREKSIIVIEGALMMFFGAALLFMAVFALGMALFMWLRCYMAAPLAAVLVALLYGVCGAWLLTRGRGVSRNGGGPAE